MKQLKLCNVTVVPTFINGCQNLTLLKQQEKIIIIRGEKSICLKSVAGYTLDDCQVYK